MTHALGGDLRAGVSALGLALDDSQVGQLLAYLDLLQKWTRVYNLTAVRNPAEMLTHHLLDSLSVIAPLKRHLAVRMHQDALGPNAAVRLLDVGAGAGLPGVVIAICCPDITVHCVDTVAKKAAFVQQAAATLRLPNLRGVHSRVERLVETYDVVSSRAFASLSDFVAWSQNALAANGVWMAMKGKHPADELSALPAFATVFHVEPLAVPGLDADRCLIWLRREVAPN